MWYFGNTPVKAGGRYKLSIVQEKEAYFTVLQIDEVCNFRDYRNVPLTDCCVNTRDLMIMIKLKL